MTSSANLSLSLGFKVFRTHTLIIFMSEIGTCKRCGKERRLTEGLCDDCYIRENEGPCGCFVELERFK